LYFRQTRGEDIARKGEKRTHASSKGKGREILEFACGKKSYALIPRKDLLEKGREYRKKAKRKKKRTITYQGRRKKKKNPGYPQRKLASGRREDRQIRKKKGEEGRKPPAKGKRGKSFINFVQKRGAGIVVVRKKSLWRKEPGREKKKKKKGIEV